MSITEFKDAAVELARTNIALAEPIVFALGFAESIAFISLFVPSSALFVAIGGFHSAAGGQFWTTWLAASTGAFLGDILSYCAGRWFKDDLGAVWPLNRNPSWYPATLAYFKRWGFWSVLFGKFLGFARPFIPVVAGALHMPVVPFLISAALASLAWAGVFLAPGYGIALLVR